jgi:general secretion pathway protein H
MTLFPTARMVSKVERDLLPTLQTGTVDRRRGEQGFTLIEVICVLAIIALLAAIVVPILPRGTSRARLESYAIQTAALLKADRNAAIRRRTQIATDVSASARAIRSGSTGRIIRVPSDVVFDAALATHCNQRRSGETIRFFASGMSCGGVIAFTRLGVGYQVRVNWLTGGVEVVPVNLL